jgi:uncharacterized protein (TIGR03083 family)
VDRVAAYTGTRERLLALGRTLDETDGDITVPACPQWTVRDMYAHLVGINADALGGRLEGVAEDWWTQRQVDDRADRALTEILDEWDDIGPSFLAVLSPDGTPPELVLDAWTHEQDVRGAVGRPGGPSAGSTREHAVLMSGWATSSVTSSGLEPLTIVLDGAASGDDLHDRTLTVGAHEFLRGAFGRRSRGQLQRWDWAGIDDVEPYVDALLIFGVADRDLVEPPPPDSAF